MRDVQEIIAEIKKAVSGKDRILLWILMAILARGNILLEDIPGVGKTTIALAFSRALGLSYGRVQFTPDVLPSDITGYSVYNTKTGQMEYRPGAVLCNLFLADELNRATSRTQSAMLEAMEEGHVTVDGVTHAIPRPFSVIATQNPTGDAGTQLLPESQMDRFTVRLSVGYPKWQDEVQMLMRRSGGVNPLESVQQVVSAEELAEMQQRVSELYVKPDVLGYIVTLVGRTRKDESLLRGASPRATLAVTDMARAMAFVCNRDYVIPEDVKAVFPETVCHRLITRSGGDGREIVDKILIRTPMPRV